MLLCPIHKRPLCVDCSKTEAGRIIPIHNFFNYRRITPALNARLQFRYFIHHKIKQNYLSDLINTILPYAQQRKNDLLEVLLYQTPRKMSQTQLTAIINFDLKAFYSDTRHFFEARIDLAMGFLCGIDGESEDFSVSVDRFIRQIKSG